MAHGLRKRPADPLLDDDCDLGRLPKPTAKTGQQKNAQVLAIGETCHWKTRRVSPRIAGGGGWWEGGTARHLAAAGRGSPVQLSFFRGANKVECASIAELHS